MPPDPRSDQPPGDPWLFILLGPFLGVVAAWLWAEAADNAVEYLGRLVIGGSLFLTLGLLVGGLAAAVSVASARRRMHKSEER